MTPTPHDDARRLPRPARADVRRRALRELAGDVALHLAERPLGLAGLLGALGDDVEGLELLTADVLRRDAARAEGSALAHRPA